MPAEPQVDERRAAVLMGLSPSELRSLASRAALGHAQEGSFFFTYEELRRLSLMAGRNNE